MPGCAIPRHKAIDPERYRYEYRITWDLLDFHVVNVGSICTGPTHGEGRLQPHPGDVLKSTPECPEEPQIRLESGGEAERSPFFLKYQV